MPTQEIFCPICNKIYTSKPILEYPSICNNFCYYLYKCDICDFQFWDPRQLSNKGYLEDEFNLYSDFHDGTRQLPNRFSFLFKYKKLFSKKKFIKILDVGCGDGLFLKTLCDYFPSIVYSSYGVDFDSKSINISKNKNRINNTFCESLEDFVARGVKDFDLICIFEVLEHQANPKLFLLKLRELLTNDGMILGTVPNRSRIFANEERLILKGDFPPHHFLWFSKSSLIKLFKISNFTHSFCEPYFFSIDDIASCIQNFLFAKHTQSIKKFIRNVISINKRNSEEQILKHIYNNTSVLNFILKLMRIIVLAPFIAFIYIARSQNGRGLFFCVKK